MQLRLELVMVSIFCITSIDSWIYLKPSIIRYIGTYGNRQILQLFERSQNIQICFNSVKFYCFPPSLNLNSKMKQDWGYILAVLGLGRTVINYRALTKGMLSFPPNKELKIFSKGAGSNPDLWGVMVSSQPTV